MTANVIARSIESDEGDAAIPGEAVEPLWFLAVTYEIASRVFCSR